MGSNPSITINFNIGGYMKSPYRDESHPLNPIYVLGCGDGYADGIASWDEEEGQSETSCWKNGQYEGEAEQAYQAGYDNGYANGGGEE